MVLTVHVPCLATTPTEALHHPHTIYYRYSTNNGTTTCIIIILIILFFMYYLENCAENFRGASRQIFFLLSATISSKLICFFFSKKKINSIVTLALPEVDMLTNPPTVVTTVVTSTHLHPRHRHRSPHVTVTAAVIFVIPKNLAAADQLGSGLEHHAFASCVLDEGIPTTSLPTPPTAHPPPTSKATVAMGNHGRVTSH